MEQIVASPCFPLILISRILTFYPFTLVYIPHQFNRTPLSSWIPFSLLLSLFKHSSLMRFRSGSKIKREIIESQDKLKADEGNPESNENGETDPAELKQLNFGEQVCGRITYHTENDFKSGFGLDPSFCLVDSFLGRNVKTPLEIIYEDYDGEEAEEELLEKKTARGGIDKFPPLSLDCTQTYSEANFYFMWEEEQEYREGLIEIAFDVDDDKKARLQFDVEEENLIEIDISQTKYVKFPTEALELLR